MGKGKDHNDIINKIFTNMDNLEFIVLGQGNKNKHGAQKFRIKFLITGYEKECLKIEILSRNVWDKYSPSRYGIACIGEISTVDKKQEFILWGNMISRCYNKKDKNYSYYGGAGVTVENNWLCFENFYNDISLIDGYDKIKFEAKQIVLDKDIKQINKPKEERIYSLKTCMFVSKKENGRARDTSKYRLKFIAISPEGEKIISNIGAIPFAKKYGLIGSSVCNCLHGVISQHKGWKFKLIEEECNDHSEKK